MEVDVPRLKMHTDLRKIEQILSNLVSNAIKYTPKGGTVTLAAATEDEEVVFRVSDTGNGVPQEVRDDLFAAYEGAGSPDADSVGLGLWICKTFTDVLDGTIDVDTGPDGTTFTVRFPKDALQTDGQG
jgi:signal transduction histidine kinase